jgi:hypothetical protein
MVLVVGDADVVVAVVVRLVVVGREVVVFFVVVGVLELLGVAMTAAAGCSCLVLGAMPAPTKNDSRANGITAFHRRCPGSVTNHHTAGPRNADPTRKGQAARSMSPPRMRRPPKTIPIIARMVFMI